MQSCEVSMEPAWFQDSAGIISPEEDRGITQKRRWLIMSWISKESPQRKWLWDIIIKVDVMVEYLVAKTWHQPTCICMGTQAQFSSGLHLNGHTWAYPLQQHPPHCDGQKPLIPLVHMSFSFSVVYVSYLAKKANSHSGQSREKS